MNGEPKSVEWVDDGPPLSRSAGWIVINRAMSLRGEELLRLEDEAVVEEAAAVARLRMLAVIESCDTEDAQPFEILLPEHEALFLAALQLTADSHQDDPTSREAADVLESGFLQLEAIEFASQGV